MKISIIQNTQLEELTDAIILQHGKIQMTAEQMVEAMIKCGEDMIQLRGLVPKGTWGQWVQEKLHMHRKTAATYIRFARHAAILREHQPTTVGHARRVLQEIGIPPVDSTLDRQKQAKKMKNDGATYQDVANHFGVPKSTASYWLNANKLNANKKKHNALLQKTKAQAQRQRAKAAMKDAKGTELSTAYSYTRKALDALQKMQNLNKEDPKVKEFVSKAMDRLYKAEDLLVLASQEKYKSNK